MGSVTTGPWWMVALNVMLWLAAVRIARAETDEYVETIELAIAEFESGHWREAGVLFEKAHALSPSARTHRGLGLAYFEARRYVEALEHLQSALQDPRKPLTPAQRESVQKALERTNDLLGKVRFAIVPSDALLEIDGRETAWRAGPINLAAGTHRIVAHHEGRRTIDRTIEVPARQTTDLEIRLEPLLLPAQASVMGTSRAQPLVARAPPDVHASQVWPWALTISSTAVMVAGGVMIGLSQADIATVEDAAHGVRWSELEGPYDRAPVLSVVGFSLLGVGVTGAIAGVLWLLGSGSTEDREAALPVRAGRLAVAF